MPDSCKKHTGNLIRLQHAKMTSGTCFQPRFRRKSRQNGEIFCSYSKEGRGTVAEYARHVRRRLQDRAFSRQRQRGGGKCFLHVPSLSTPAQNPKAGKFHGARESS